MFSSLAVLPMQSGLRASQVPRVSVSQPLSEVPSQSVQPVLQLILHSPFSQRAVPLVALQVWPQAPQLLMSLRAFSQPVSGASSQSPKPGLQLPSVQRPVMHEALALARPQDMLQPPQLLSSLVLVSQPSAALASQSAQPAWHAVMLQLPALQPVVSTLSPAVQALPHAPQCAFEVLRSISQPSAALPLQSP